MEPVNENPVLQTSWRTIARNSAFILAALLVFLFALDLMLTSLQYLGKGASETIILATSNPFMALFIGLLVTALIQSSTAVTSLVVALVASGSLTLETAIPIIMGANVGTTVTSLFVSLGFLNKRKEFRRAVSAGAYHTFFNLLTVLVLFPLEFYFHFLSGISSSLAALLFSESSPGGPTLSFQLGFGHVTAWIVELIDSGPVLLILAPGLLFASILIFRSVLTRQLGLRSPERFQSFFFHRTPISFFWGFISTAAIRSSSVTTSLVVPLVAGKIVSLRKAVPFILGANVGTTLSAFLASLVHSRAAISIAIAHILFNVIGILLFYPVLALRELPIRLARGLGKLTHRFQLAGPLFFIVALFFIIPFSLIFFNRQVVRNQSLTYERTDDQGTSRYKVITRTLENQSMSSWTVKEGAETEAPGVYSVYRRRRLLMINNEIYELSRPGFCRDGEDKDGRYQMCIQEMIPHLKVTSSISVDSVFVFRKVYQRAGLPEVRISVSAASNALISREKVDSTGQVILRERLIGIEEK